MPDRTRTAEAIGGRIADLDRLLEHRTRLAVCVLLSREPELSFSRFRALLDETDGNLGAQLRRLEDAGYVSIEKTFVGRKPQTLYRLTERGRQRLASHLDALEVLIGAGTGG
ncbi:MAG: winged helix-turn-helix domain-containing protein [Rhodothalassiaceae bacterium]